MIFLFNPQMDANHRKLSLIGLSLFNHAATEFRQRGWLSCLEILYKHSRKCAVIRVHSRLDQQPIRLESLA